MKKPDPWKNTKNPAERRKEKKRKEELFRRSTMFSINIFTPPISLQLHFTLSMSIDIFLMSGHNAVQRIAIDVKLHSI
jgi:hypothetical protein